MDLVDGSAKELLKQYVSRIERLEEEKTNLSNDIKDLYAEAKSKGFVPNVMKKVISARKLDADKLLEQEELFDLYKNAVGLKTD